MSKPPRPDKLPGPIRYKKPSGNPEDRPLGRIHREFEDHKRAQRGQRPSAAKQKAELAKAAPRAKKR
jgi:hypothetical protein